MHINKLCNLKFSNRVIYAKIASILKYVKHIASIIIGKCINIVLKQTFYTYAL